jgi:hypothetical protein
MVHLQRPRQEIGKLTKYRDDGDDLDEYEIDDNNDQSPLQSTNGPSVSKEETDDLSEDSQQDQHQTALSSALPRFLMRFGSASDRPGVVTADAAGIDNSRSSKWVESLRHHVAQTGIQTQNPALLFSPPTATPSKKFMRYTSI